MNARTAWKILFSFARYYEWAFPDGYAPFNTISRRLSPLSWNFTEEDEKEFLRFPEKIQKAATVVAVSLNKNPLNENRFEFDRADFQPQQYERLGMEIRYRVLHSCHSRWHKWNYHMSQGFAPLEAKPLVDRWINWGDRQALDQLGNFN